MVFFKINFCLSRLKCAETNAEMAFEIDDEDFWKNSEALDALFENNSPGNTANSRKY